MSGAAPRGNQSRASTATTTAHVALGHHPSRSQGAITGLSSITHYPCVSLCSNCALIRHALIGDATSLRMHGGLSFRSIRSISAQTYARSRSHRRVKEGRALHIFPCASTPGTRPGRGKEVPGRLQTGCGVGRARGAKWHKTTRWLYPGLKLAGTEVRVGAMSQCGPIPNPHGPGHLWHFLSISPPRSRARHMWRAPSSRGRSPTLRQEGDLTGSFAYACQTVQNGLVACRNGLNCKAAPAFSDRQQGTGVRPKAAAAVGPCSGPQAVPQRSPPRPLLTLCPGRSSIGHTARHMSSGQRVPYPISSAAVC